LSIAVIKKTAPRFLCGAFFVNTKCGIVAYIFSHNELRTKSAIQFTLYEVKQFMKSKISIHASQRLAIHEFPSHPSKNGKTA
jgi:hypothetical protein